MAVYLPAGRKSSPDALRTQIITPGYNGTNTTVLNVPAWDGSKNTRNIGTCWWSPRAMESVMVYMVSYPPQCLFPL